MQLFDFYRRLLLIVVTVYATVRILQTLFRWRRWFGGREKHKRLARGYVMAMAASVRIRRFWRELLQIALLLIVLGLVVAAHGYVM